MIQNFLFDFENSAIVHPSCVFAYRKAIFIGCTPDGLPSTPAQHKIAPFVAYLHYFSKETALETLKATGYTIVDYFYAPRSNEIGPNFVQKLFRARRAILFAIRQDFAARLLGGYSLMILAE